MKWNKETKDYMESMYGHKVKVITSNQKHVGYLAHYGDVVKVIGETTHEISKDSIKEIVIVWE